MEIKAICSWYENENYGFAQFSGFEGSIKEARVVEYDYYNYPHYEVGKEICPLNFEDLRVTRPYHDPSKKVWWAEATAKAEWQAKVLEGLYAVCVKGYIRNPWVQGEIWQAGCVFFEVDASPPSVPVEIKDASLRIFCPWAKLRLRVDGKEESLESQYWTFKWSPPSSRWFFEPHEIEIEAVDDIGNQAKISLSPIVFDPYSEEEKMLGVTLNYTIPYDGKVKVVVRDCESRKVLKELVKEEFRRAGVHKEYWDGMIDDPNILYPFEDNIGVVDGLYYLEVSAKFDNGGSWWAKVPVRIWVDRPGVE